MSTKYAIRQVLLIKGKENAPRPPPRLPFLSSQSKRIDGHANANSYGPFQGGECHRAITKKELEDVQGESRHSHVKESGDSLEMT